MIVYLLKASLLLGIAFVFYKAVLQQESFFATNRLYLLGCLVLAFALPFVSLPKLVNNQGYLAALLQTVSDAEAHETVTELKQARPETTLQVQQEVSAQPQVDPAAQATVKEEPFAAQTSWLFWLTMLYLFGAAVFLLSLLFQVGNLVYKIITATDKIEDGNCVIVTTASRQAPCSFFKYIFIYPDDYDFETYEQIIAHEKVHAGQRHTLDLLLAELAVIILWFNPLSWLFRKEVEKNNEYQTDAILLDEEQVSRDRYQLNLLQIAVPNKPLSITTNYNQSLLKQRIMMMNAKRSTPHAYWKYTFLVPLFFGTLLLLNEPAASQEKHIIGPAPVPAVTSTYVPSPPDAPVTAVPTPPDAPAVPNPVSAAPQDTKTKPSKKRGNSISINGGQTDMSAGYWYGHQEAGNYCLELKGSRNTSNWNISQCYAKGLFQKKGNDVYEMTKEAGTLQLTGGTLDAEVSQGKYTFTENAAFKKYLASNKIESDNKNFLFHLFLGDVDRKYVDYLRQQYGTVESERLLELAIHGVTLPDFQGYVGLFEKYSNKKPSVQEVVEARIHGIDQQYVQDLQAMGYKDLSMKKMMEAKIHGVNSAYVEGLKKAGFDKLSIDKVIEAKIHGLTPAAIQEMQGLGFGKLDLVELMNLKIHGVNAAYVKDLQSAGLQNLSAEQAVSAKIHGLNAATIKELRALGFQDMDLNDMMNASIHGVTAAYVKDLQSVGFQNLSVDKTIEAKIHGIDSNFIKKARQKGYNLSSIDKYISLKIHGMAMESLKE